MLTQSRASSPSQHVAMWHHTYFHPDSAWGWKTTLTSLVLIWPHRAGVGTLVQAVTVTYNTNTFISSVQCSGVVVEVVLLRLCLIFPNLVEWNERMIIDWINFLNNTENWSEPRPRLCLNVLQTILKQIRELRRTLAYLAYLPLHLNSKNARGNSWRKKVVVNS